MAGFLIGNYIHYRASNYLKYGTTMSQKSSGRALNLEKILEDKHAFIKMQFQAQQSDKFKEQYQETLNYLFGKEGSLLSKKEEQEALEKEFKKIVQEKFPNIIIDYATLNTDGASALQQIDINKRVSKGKTRMSFDFIEKQIDELSKFMYRQEIKDKYSEKELKQHRNILQRITKIEQEMFTMAKAGVGYSPAFVKMSKKNKASTGLGLNLAKLNLKQKSFFSDLNYLISLYNISNKSIIQGELGELSAAFAGAKMQGIGANELKKFIEEAMIGDKNKTSSGYWQADFSSTFVNLAKLGETKGWEHHSDNGGYVKAIMPTQNKIDIQIETPEGKKTLSVKNYNLKNRSTISAMTGVSFLTLIQNENQDNFINHYFNITAEHPAPDDNEVPLMQIRDRIHSLMKQIILINALTGLNISKTALDGMKSNQDVAKYFVINDSSKSGKFKIFTMSELLNLATGDQAGFSKFAKVSGYNDPTWDNMWAESGPQERITKILMQAHQMKLHVGIAANAIR